METCNSELHLYLCDNRISKHRSATSIHKSKYTITDKQLTEDFAKYFRNKIDKIRDKFTGIEPYMPRQLDIPQLVKFALVTSSQLEKTIKKMQPKTCGLDIIPTSKLQEMLPGCLPSITHLVNSSLDQGTFSEDWKEALVKPLIKKENTRNTE